MLTLAPDEARALMVAHHGLARRELPRGAAGVRALVDRAGCIQLDPLDPMGQNADLVALARVDGIARGEVYRHSMPGHAFEHFAKERCLLPARAFPYYRGQSAETPWWRMSERLRKIPGSILAAVLAEVQTAGPCTVEELTDHGRVEPIEWQGWKSSSRATPMALDVLWTRCQIVVCGRRNGRKVFDVPERALPALAGAAGGDFQRFALVERVRSAGMLARAGGAHWSMLAQTRTSSLPDDLVTEGILEEAEVAGSARRYFVPPGFAARKLPRVDDRMRILAPLDALIWDRLLVKHIFGFDYVWEVYKPVEQRIWGWYVCPLLHRGRLVGRIDGAIARGALRVRKVWVEDGVTLDDAALDEALERHAFACGVDQVVRPRQRRR